MRADPTRASTPQSSGGCDIAAPYTANLTVDAPALRARIDQDGAPAGGRVRGLTAGMVTRGVQGEARAGDVEATTVPLARITASATPFHGTRPGLSVDMAPSGIAPVDPGSR
jgi:hypothetical protein